MTFDLMKTSGMTHNNPKEKQSVHFGSMKHNWLSFKKVLHCGFSCLWFIAVEVELDDYMVEDFLNEVIIMRRFKHPNVLKLLGVTVHEDKPCMVMPLMITNLKCYLKQNKLVSIWNNGIWLRHTLSFDEHVSCNQWSMFDQITYVWSHSSMKLSVCGPSFMCINAH